MMTAYNLRRKDYTNSFCIARLGLKRPAGFTLKKNNYRKQKVGRREQNRKRMMMNKTARRTGAGVRRSTDW